MDIGKNEMVKDLHTGKVYRIIKIEYGIVLLEDIEETGRMFTNTTSLQGLFTKVEKEWPRRPGPTGP